MAERLSLHYGFIVLSLAMVSTMYTYNKAWAATHFKLADGC